MSFMRWLVNGCMGQRDGWTGCDVGGKLVGRTNVSTRRNMNATMGIGTGAPPLDIEGMWAMGSGGWHQLRRCFKDMECFCWRSKIIQIE